MFFQSKKRQFLELSKLFVTVAIMALQESPLGNLQKCYQGHFEFLYSPYQILVRN